MNLISNEGGNTKSKQNKNTIDFDRDKSLIAHLHWGSRIRGNVAIHRV